MSINGSDFAHLQALEEHLNKEGAINVIMTVTALIAEIRRLNVIIDQFERSAAHDARKPKQAANHTQAVRGKMSPDGRPMRRVFQNGQRGS